MAKSAPDLAELQEVTAPFGLVRPRENDEIGLQTVQGGQILRAISERLLRLHFQDDQRDLEALLQYRHVSP